MTAKKFNDTERESLGFAEAIHEHITPLVVAKGFVCTDQTLYSATFQSPNVIMTVVHEPLSYEIELSYALRNTPSERYNLSDLLDTVLGTGHNLQTFFQASERHQINYCVKTVADYLLKYGEKMLVGNVAMYQKIKEATRRRSVSHTKEVVQRPVRIAAEAAWKEHNYATVRQLYEPIERDLTPAERRRLDYARSKVHG